VVAQEVVEVDRFETADEGGFQGGEVPQAFFGGVESREVSTKDLFVDETRGKPLKEVEAGLAGDGEREMKRRLGEGGRDVPPTARKIEKIAGFQETVPERGCGRGDGRNGVAIGGDRMRPAHAVDFPRLASVKMKDEDIVVIPVEVEAARRAPAGVEVDVDAFAAGEFERFGDRPDGGHLVVDVVDDERGAGFELGGDVAGTKRASGGVDVAIQVFGEECSLFGEFE
jgi:hypothetical protein